MGFKIRLPNNSWIKKEVMNENLKISRIEREILVYSDNEIFYSSEHEETTAMFSSIDNA